MTGASGQPRGGGAGGRRPRSEVSTPGPCTQRRCRARSGPPAPTISRSKASWSTSTTDGVGAAHLVLAQGHDLRGAGGVAAGGVHVRAHTATSACSSSSSSMIRVLATPDRPRCSSCRRAPAPGSGGSSPQLPIVEGGDQPADHVVRHVLVDVVGQLTNWKSGQGLLDPPRQVGGIDRQAVAADASPGRNGMKPNGLVAAASIASHTSMSRSRANIASSFTGRC